MKTQTHNFEVTLRIKFDSEGKKDFNGIVEQHLDFFFEQMRDVAEDFAACIAGKRGIVKKSSAPKALNQ